MLKWRLSQSKAEDLAFIAKAKAKDTDHERTFQELLLTMSSFIIVLFYVQWIVGTGLFNSQTTAVSPSGE